MSIVNIVKCDECEYENEIEPWDKGIQIIQGNGDIVTLCKQHFKEWLLL